VTTLTASLQSCHLANREVPMNRRAFLMALSGSLLATPLAARAQQAGKV
jgi:hypothetical protein